jgi:hypothetical protein
MAHYLGSPHDATPRGCLLPMSSVLVSSFHSCFMTNDTPYHCPLHPRPPLQWLHLHLCSPQLPQPWSHYQCPLWHLVSLSSFVARHWIVRVPCCCYLHRFYQLRPTFSSDFPFWPNPWCHCHERFSYPLMLIACWLVLQTLLAWPLCISCMKW